MNQDELKKHRCCFTGHRPEKLCCDERMVKAKLKSAFEMNWNKTDKVLYFKVLKNADIAKTISNTYYRACYQKINEWMVDRSSRVIAAYNGERGGTANTIEYAQRQGPEVINIFDN